MPPIRHRRCGKRNIPKSTDQIEIGETVTVIRFGISIPPYIEGVASTVQAIGSDLYVVTFAGELTLKTRVVFREFQHNPEKFLAIMTALWRAENAMLSDADDFFPKDHD